MTTLQLTIAMFGPLTQFLVVNTCGYVGGCTQDSAPKGGVHCLAGSAFFLHLVGGKTTLFPALFIRQSQICGAIAVCILPVPVSFHHPPDSPHPLTLPPTPLCAAPPHPPTPKPLLPPLPACPPLLQMGPAERYDLVVDFSSE
jgi:hypothetical protein